MIAFRPAALIPFSLVLAFGLAACGGSSNGNPNGSAGSNGSTGGSHGSGGSSGSGGTSGGGGATGTCGDVPPCLANLIAGCTPSGTCIQQMSGSITTGGITNNTCYSNGVKQSTVETIDSTFTSATVAVTYSKSGTICFSEGGAFPLGAGGSSGSLTFSIKNGSGAVVATLTENTVTGGTTVTCGGQTYAVTNMGSCGMTMPNVGGTGGTAGTNCTQGSCP